MDDGSSSPGALRSGSPSCQEDGISSDTPSLRPQTPLSEVVPSSSSFFATDVVLSQVLLLCGVLAPLGIFIFITSIPQRAFLSGSGACDPDGNFSPDRTFYTDSGFSTPFGPTSKNFNAWSRGGLFQITLGFGRLPFSTVKIIDVLWDVLVGRGGQLCLAFLVYKTFIKTLTRIMERATVTYDTFWSINIEPTSVQSIYQMSRDVLKIASTRFRSAVVLMACSSAYVIAFPIVVGAMTGYSTNIAAFAPDHNNALIPFTNFVPVVYVINDGSRLNLSDRYLVSGQWQSSDGTARRYDGCLGTDSHGCDFIANVSHYVSAFSLDTVHDLTSTFNLSAGTVTLDAPTLNITAFFIPDGDFSYSIGNGTSDQYRNSTQMVFASDNITYSRDYMLSYGSCVPESPTTYKWGFSFLALWIFMLASAVWAIGMYALWLEAYLHSRLDRQPASKLLAGNYKVTLDLAKAINQNIGEDVAEKLTNAALKKRIQQDLNGGYLSYRTLVSECEEKLPCTTRYHELNQQRRSLGRWEVNWWLCAGIVVAAIIIIVPISRASKQAITGG